LKTSSSPTFAAGDSSAPSASRAAATNQGAITTLRFFICAADSGRMTSNFISHPSVICATAASLPISQESVLLQTGTHFPSDPKGHPTPAAQHSCDRTKRDSPFSVKSIQNR
jgi:hypothetical protein